MNWFFFFTYLLFMSLCEYLNCIWSDLTNSKSETKDVKCKHSGRADFGTLRNDVHLCQVLIALAKIRPK